MSLISKGCQYMLKQYLEIGQIVSTHGVKGEIRVNPWCDTPEFMKKFKLLLFFTFFLSVREM